MCIVPLLGLQVGKGDAEPLQDDHGEHHKFVASGTKQLKIAKALYDHHCFAASPCGDLLRRSVTVLRETVVPALSKWILYIDRSLVLVLEAAGPSFRNEAVLAQPQEHRRVGNTYYDRIFASMILRESLLLHGRIRPLMQQVMCLVSCSLEILRIEQCSKL